MLEVGTIGAWQMETQTQAVVCMAARTVVSYESLSAGQDDIGHGTNSISGTTSDMALIPAKSSRDPLHTADRIIRRTVRTPFCCACAAECLIFGGLAPQGSEGAV